MHVGFLFIGASPVLVDEKDVGLLVLGLLERCPGAQAFLLPFVASGESGQADVLDGLAIISIIVREGQIHVKFHAHLFRFLQVASSLNHGLLAFVVHVSDAKVLELFRRQRRKLLLSRSSLWEWGFELSLYSVYCT